MNRRYTCIGPRYPRYCRPPPGGYGLQEYSIRNYLPFRLMYQVTVHCRNALHDRYLQSIFRTDVFGVRPFWIWNPMDETWRRTELVQTVASDLSETTESGTKRIFRKVYTVNMLAEIPQDRIIDSYTYKALRVFIPVVDIAWFDDYYNQMLKNQPTPLDTFTQEERTDAGEFFHLVHEGHGSAPSCCWSPDVDLRRRVLRVRPIWRYPNE